MQSPQFFRNCSSAVAFSCLAWDWLITAPQEYKYIWGSRSTPVKWIYVVSRYAIGLGAHIGNLVFLVGPLSAHSIPNRSCRAWLCLHTSVFVAQFTALQLLLGLRIYALYNKNRMVAWFVCAITVICVSTQVICGIYTVLHLPFDEQCIGSDPPPAFGVIGGTVVISQVIMWGMTIYKRRTAERDGWSDAPLMRLIVRDDVVVSVGVLAMAFVINSFAFRIMVVTPHVMYLWPNTLLTIFTCRLILNLSHLRPDVSREPGISGPDEHGVELTTVFRSIDEPSHVSSVTR